MDSIHVAVTRQVKPGCEEEFEHILREFARESLREPGTTGVHLIEPVSGTKGCEYGILRSFDSEDASRHFYQSEIFLQWQKRAEPLVVGDSAVRRLHGLEAFFRESKHAPPRWKMAIVTWLGVFPTVLLWSSALPQFLGGTPKLFVVGVVNVFVVVTLTWAVMPLLTKLLAGWLQASNKK